MSSLLIEIQCIGNIYFWSALVKERNVIFEQYERFQKSGYRNRYQVLGSNGPITLSIPLMGGRENNRPIREVYIDNSTSWQKLHWRTLESCYNKSPFFFYYQDALREFYISPYKSLWDFNWDLYQWILSRIRITIKTELTTDFVKVPQPEIIDLRGKLKPTNREEFLFDPYLQVFGNEFQGNLSLFDILFNIGPETSSYLLKQRAII